MTFEQALQAMREGKGVKRKAWENEVDNPIDYIRLDKRENSGEYDTYFTHNKSTTIRGSFYFKTEHVMFDNIVLSGNQPDDKDRVKLNCDMEVSKEVSKSVFEMLKRSRKTSNEEQPEKKKYLSEAMNKSKDKITKYVQGQMDKAFEEMSDNLKKSIAESIEKQSAEMKLVAREQVETNYYNTICSKDGYKIIYETNSRNNYEEIQEHIRQFIDRNNEKQDEETARKVIEEMKCKHKNENKASCSCLCSCGETDKEIAELKKEVERLKALVLYGKR